MPIPSSSPCSSPPPLETDNAKTMMILETLSPFRLEFFDLTLDKVSLNSNEKRRSRKSRFFQPEGIDDRIFVAELCGRDGVLAYKVPCESITPQWCSTLQDTFKLMSSDRLVEQLVGYNHPIVLQLHGVWQDWDSCCCSGDNARVFHCASSPKWTTDHMFVVCSPFCCGFSIYEHIILNSCKDSYSGLPQHQEVAEHVADKPARTFSEMLLDLKLVAVQSAICIFIVLAEHNKMLTSYEISQLVIESQFGFPVFKPFFFNNISNSTMVDFASCPSSSSSPASSSAAAVNDDDNNNNSCMKDPFKTLQAFADECFGDPLQQRHVAANKHIQELVRGLHVIITSNNNCHQKQQRQRITNDDDNRIIALKTLLRRSVLRSADRSRNSAVQLAKLFLSAEVAYPLVVKTFSQQQRQQSIIISKTPSSTTTPADSPHSTMTTSSTIITAGTNSHDTNNNNITNVNSTQTSEVTSSEAASPPPPPSCPSSFVEDENELLRLALIERAGKYFTTESARADIDAAFAWI